MLVIEGHFECIYQFYQKWELHLLMRICAVQRCKWIAFAMFTMQNLFTVEILIFNPS